MEDMNTDYGYYQPSEPGAWTPPAYEEPEHYFLGALGAIGGALICHEKQDSVRISVCQAGAGGICLFVQRIPLVFRRNV